MALILNPAITAEIGQSNFAKRVGGRAVSNTGDGYAARLLRYIPVPIAGLYPVLDSALDTYRKSPAAGLPANLIDRVVFALFLVAILIEINVAYNKKRIHGRMRWAIQITQSLFCLAAFVLWTYTVKGQIWGGQNNGPLVIILDGLFLLFAGYQPKLTPTEATQAGYS